MSPFKRKASPYWQVRPTVVIPGVGKVRTAGWSTGTRDRRRAEAMEAVVRELPMLGYGDVLQMLIRGEVSIQEVYAAHLSRQLDLVRARAGDPLLSEVIAGFRPQVRDDRVLAGLDRLLGLAEGVAGGGLRRSWLTDPRNIARVLLAREAEGIRRNSVRRSLYRAISDLLAWELGKGRKTEIMAEVNYPAENDERQVTLSQEQIQVLLDAAVEDRFRCALELALTSGIDRSPLLALEGRHFNPGRGELALPDRKTRSRLRTLQLSARAQAAVRTAMVLGRVGPGDRVFPWTVGQFRERWDATRERAEMEWLRFKDLRAVFATYFLLAGGSPKQLREVMGHSDLATTLRYVKRLPARQGKEMEATAEYLGMGRHLRVERGGA